MCWRHERRICPISALNTHTVSMHRSMPRPGRAGPREQSRLLRYRYGEHSRLGLAEYRAAVKQSEIRRQSTQLALTAKQRQLIARLDEAYSEAAMARDQLASLDLSVNTAAESLRLTKLAYTGGEATVLEVVDAQSAYVASAECARGRPGSVRKRACRSADADRNIVRMRVRDSRREPLSG